MRPLGPTMLEATLLALGAAVLHAGWNFAIKQAAGDRLCSLWAQFGVAAIISAVILVAVGGLPGRAWIWASMSGAIHVVYLVQLARAYDEGDFSLAYPVARGLGAFCSAIGGVVLLGDRFGIWSWVALTIVGIGLVGLASGAPMHSLKAAIAVGLMIGCYTLADSKGARSSGTFYAMASHVGTGIGISTYGVATGRRAGLVTVLRSQWRRAILTGVAGVATYWMVLMAVRRAEVGYVTAIRESSVVIAAFIGWRTLGEAEGKRRLQAACVVVAGLVLLILSK
jgi:drug/metabolite transporter (DMT)-like permease